VQGRGSLRDFRRMKREMSDTFTTVAVKTAIVRDPELRAAAIHVATWCNVVQLSGFVESRQVVGRALAITRGVRGVSGVRNDMRLK
jgi:hyperosmotically inducible protein